MSGFKLIAIRPLEGCSDRFLKVLKPNELYQFYNDYHFKYKEGDAAKDVIGIDYKPTIPEDLYNITCENGKILNVNISAIVGKNGSGKSSLLELLYLGAFMIGVDEEILKDAEQLELEKKQLIKTFKYRSKIYDNTIISYEKHEKYESDFLIEAYKKEYNEFKEKHTLRIKELEDIILDINCFKHNLKLELYFSVGELIYRTKIDNGIKTICLNKKSERVLISNLFYSIVLNYSIYGLNSLHMGYWIQTLFHKNDGYKTPIVLNPMRTDGRYNINEENQFATYRLIHNILIEKKTKKKGEKVYITDKQYVSKIRYRYNGKKLTKVNNEILRFVSKFLKEFESFTPIAWSLLENSEGNPFFNEICTYLYGKVEKITKTYEDYKEISEIEPSLTNASLLSKLNADGSHITNKVRQAINFLVVNGRNSQKNNSWFDLYEKDGSSIDFTLDELIEWMACDKNEILNHLPPSLFEAEIILMSKDESNKDNDSKFIDLSSGEQQLIHSVQSVLYHLNNLQSIFKSSTDRVTYDNINIIFDEIELYFHPDYQRKFISKLLRSIENLDLGKQAKGIKALNILFSTHSPFILSDIPTSNILFLKSIEGKRIPQKVKLNTFGANIHELLTHSFFMEDGFMGEFAKKKIEETIQFLNIAKLVRSQYELNDRLSLAQNESSINKEKINSKLEVIELELKNLQKISNIDISRWKNNQPPDELTKYNHQIINTIGEPILKNKLESMYNDIFQNDHEKLELLEKLANDLGVTINYPQF